MDSLTDSTAGPPPIDRAAPTTTETTVLALGCFWGVEAVFGALDGVIRTTVGFAGGRAPNPTYAAIDDHAEAVRVEYAPTRLGYTALLDRFWSAFDPALTPAKRRYQPLLVPSTDGQAKEARVSRAEAAKHDGRARRVEIIDEGSFHPAALRHQKHLLRRYDEVTKALRARLPGERAFTRSPAATLATGYVGGNRDPSRLAEDQDRLGLPEEALATLREAARRQQGWDAFVRTEQAAA